jgi:RNA polymerase sigma factor (sigma-70 family)
MTTARLAHFLERLRRRIGPEAAGELSDACLLRRFAADRDAAAFEVLVWRHGPMVLGVCRRLLRHEQDAEDAFQAAFLTLARKAHSIGRSEAVAGWLYRVAHRIALRARTAAARRPGGRPIEESDAATGPDADALWRDLRTVLDEEIGRLPGRCREAFVLCCLQGKTYAEAARELGCPPGTVATRLAAARERLRARLTRRGISPAGTVPALPPRELVGAAVRAGAATAAGKAAGAVSARAAAWSNGFLRGMLMTKMKIAVVVAAAVGLAGGAACLLRTPPAAVTSAAVAAEPSAAGGAAQAAPAPEPAQPADKDAGRVDEARRQVEVAEKQWEVLEQAWAEKRIRVRSKLLGTQDDLEQAQQQLTDAREEHRRLAARLEEIRSQAKDPDKDVPRGLLEKEQTLRKGVQEAEAGVGRARRDEIAAEEELDLLERLHAFQRDKARADVEDARAALRQALGTAPRDEGPGRSLRDLERKVDALTDELGALRRELRRQGGDKTKPPPGLPERP